MSISRNGGWSRTKKAGVAGYLIALVLASALLVAFPLAVPSGEGGEYSVTTQEAPIVREMHNATAEMSLASTSWGDYYPTEPPYPQYWGALASDGEHFRPGDLYDEFEAVQWLGDSRADEWFLEFDLGRATNVSSVKFQFGDLHTPGAPGTRVGLKRFSYDVEVETSPGDWEPAAEGLRSVPDSDHSWMSEWVSGELNASLPLSEPRGSVVDWHRTVLVQPGNYREHTFDYLVADAGYRMVMAFDAEGAPSYGIWPGTDTTNLWNGTGQVPTDVALVPIWEPGFPGGYLISTDKGNASSGGLWLCEYGDSPMDPGDLRSSAFGDILQVGTYWDGGTQQLDVYVLEREPTTGDFVLHLFERGSSEYNGTYSPGESDRSRILGYEPGALAAGPDRVAVSNVDSDEVVTYNSRLEQLPGRTLEPGSGYGEFQEPTDLAAAGENLLIFDSRSEKAVSVEYEDGNFVGEFSMQCEGAPTGPIAPRPFEAASYYDEYPEGGVWVARSGSESAYLHTTEDIRSDGRYFDWHEHTVPQDEAVLGYRLRIYDMEYEVHPLVPSGSPMREETEEAWNRPAVVESFYDWVYESGDAGVEVTISEPDNWENIVARGDLATVPIGLDLDVAETRHHDQESFELSHDSVKFSVDGGENITIVGGEAQSGEDDIFLFAEDFSTLHNFEIRENYVGGDLISNHSLEPGSEAYYETEVDLGESGYVYQVWLYNWLDYNDSNAGNTLELFIDGESFRLVDETYKWLNGYHQVDLGRIALGGGNHTFKVKWRGGSGKVDHNLLKLRPLNYEGGLVQDEILELEGSSGEGISSETFELDLPSSGVYRIECPPHSWEAVDGDVWELRVDGELVEVLDESRGEGFEWDSRDLGAAYIARGGHELEVNCASGPAGTLPPLRLSYDRYEFEGTIVSEGYHTLTVWANDTAGAEDTDSVNFSVVSYPRLDILSPGDESGYDSNVTLDLYARDRDLDTVRYSINNGSSILLDEVVGGYEIFHEEVITISDLEENAWNQISVVANDTNGHETFAYRTFFLDFESPRVGFPGMANNTHLPPSGMYNFSAVDETLQTAWYTINGRGRTTLEPGNTTVEIPRCDFDNGKNTLRIFAIDQVGNNASTTLNLTKDDAGPVIEVSTPAEEGEFFEVNGTADPIPLEAEARDFVVNGSSPEYVSINQSQLGASLRLHGGGHLEAYQEFVATDPCLSDIEIAAMGRGRARVFVREGRLPDSEPISGGYIEPSSWSDFEWYRAGMGDARLEVGRTYYMFVISLSPYTSLYVGTGEGAYGGGRAALGGVPRPDRDLTFRLLSRGLEEGAPAAEMRAAVSGSQVGNSSQSGSLSIGNLADLCDFEHGFQRLTVHAEDDLGNEASVFRRFRYIDTGVRTNISVSLESPAGDEWIFGETPVSWEANMPDYVDRYIRENYTHSIYLSDENGTAYKVSPDTVDSYGTEMDTGLVEDGYYTVLLNSTDGESWDSDAIGLVRVVNGEPVIDLEAPPEFGYANGDVSINITVICGNLDRTTLSVDGSMNETLEPASFDFELGYTYLAEFDSESREDGVHYIDAYAKDFEGRVSGDHATVVLDTAFEIELESIGTQAEGGSILLEWGADPDAQWINLTVSNSTSVVKTFLLDGAADSYLLQEGLPSGPHRVTVRAADRAGNLGEDSVSFLVSHSAFSDALNRVVGLIEGALAFLLGLLGLGIAAAADRRRRSACPNGATCEL
jgi:hypothetical protein